MYKRQREQRGRAAWAQMASKVPKPGIVVVVEEETRCVRWLLEFLGEAEEVSKPRWVFLM